MSDYKRLTDEELYDFLSRVFVQLEPTLAQSMMSCANELLEYRSKIKNGTLFELPCVRKINSPLGKYEAVYLKEGFATIQECVVNSIERGWEVIAYYGNAHHKAIAEAKLEELKRGQK